MLMAVACDAASPLPLGCSSAIYLSEYAPDAVRSVVKPVLEVLAGVPTVVYGYFALQFIAPDVLRPSSVTTRALFNAAQCQHRDGNHDPADGRLAQ